MTTTDLNTINLTAKDICRSAQSELYNIKKEKLSLSNRIIIERTKAKLDALNILLSTKFQ